MLRLTLRLSLLIMGHRFVLVLLLGWLMTVTCEQLTEPPKWICIPDSEIDVIIGYYKYDETKNGIKEWEKNTNDVFKIRYTESYANISDTWIIFNKKNDKYLTYCTKLATNYTPTFDNPGNPIDCKEWSIFLEITNDVSDCMNLVDKFDITEWILFIYCIITTILICICIIPKHSSICFPCLKTKLNLSCKSSHYDAVLLTTYKKILLEFGM